MSTPAIKVQNLSKRYIIRHQGAERYTALRDVIMRRTRSALKRVSASFVPRPVQPDGSSEEFYALRDVSLELKQGERLGVIGRNGAGKTTLLKILSRITEPTSGRVEITGRVSSLLEVGTGFHPELTGRENIFLNGAILGLGKAEIEARFKGIVDFAGVEKFIDTPVKHYSSGMYMRLAFAVAAHLEPDILLVDEVLAVGDAQFQKKCLEKIGETGNENRTVIFVSHNMTALQSLCNRAIWIEAGRIVRDGGAKEVVSAYLQHGTYSVLEQQWDDPASAPGNDKVRLHSVRLVPQTGGEIREIDVTTPLKMEFEFWNFMQDAELNFSLHLYNEEGLCILNTPSQGFYGPKGLIKGSCLVPGNFLNDGLYRVMIMLVQDTSTYVYHKDDVLIFEVRDSERIYKWYGKWPGVVRPNLPWEVSFDK